jgi:hypothetical protein
LPTKGAAGGEGLAHLAETRQELADRFNGLTAYLRSPAKGWWTAPDGHTEQDDVVMVEASSQTRSTGHGGVPIRQRSPRVLDRRAFTCEPYRGHAGRGRSMNKPFATVTEESSRFGPELAQCAQEGSPCRRSNRDFSPAVLPQSWMARTATRCCSPWNGVSVFSRNLR